MTLLHVLALGISLSAAPPAKLPEKPSQVALIYFQQGDVTKAINTLREGLKREPKLARQMMLWLVDYGQLVRRSEALTPAQLKELIELDRRISPKKPGKLTEPFIERHLVEPLKVAALRAQAGDREGAAEIAKQVLLLDSTNADAKTLLRQLDGGTP